MHTLEALKEANNDFSCLLSEVITMCGVSLVFDGLTERITSVQKLLAED